MPTTAHDATTLLASPLFDAPQAVEILPGRTASRPFPKASASTISRLVDVSAILEIREFRESRAETLAEIGRSYNVSWWTIAKLQC